MKRIAKITLVALLVSVFNIQFSVCQAQKADNPVVFEINGKKIYKSEFMREFLRSIGKDSTAAPTACTYEKRKALEEYADLFVNYRAKLEDAFALGYDTMPDLVKELKGYRNELAAPYLIDSATLNGIMNEAYERNHYVVHAAHILVLLGKQPTPADTLKAYQKAMDYYNRVQNGEDFYAVATEAANERFAQENIPEGDPRRKDNGDLGYFTVFEMVYPFESAAFTLREGEVSKPVRTAYGYHIVKVVEKSPFFSRCSFQHIWVAESEVPAHAELRIRQAYELLQKGVSFSEVSKNNTSDHVLAEKGGMVSNVTVRQVPPEYVPLLSRMNPGDYTEPFHTQYGWHIVRLIERDTLPSFEDMEPYYKQRMVRDQRSRKPREKFVEQCKKKYNFNDYTKMYVTPKGKKNSKARVPMASLAECRAALNDSLFHKEWRYNDAMVTDMRPLFSVEEREYNAVDLLKFIESRQRVEINFDLDMYLEDRYNNFINDKVFEYADQHLEVEHNEFAALMDEYRNGLMIFSYNDNMIWSKAIKDTAGLKQFYNAFSAQRDINNVDDAPYFWNERADVTVVSVSNKDLIAPDKVMKIMEKATKKGWDNNKIAEAVNAKKKGEGTIEVTIRNLIEREHQNTLTNSQWNKGIYLNQASNTYEVVRVDNVYNPCLKSQSEARGYYVNEYQNHIEKELVKSLRKKYNVVIHQDVLDEITY